MAKKKARLGKGLGALLGDVKTTASGDASLDVVGHTPPAANFKELPVDLLQRGAFQPRIKMSQEALTELSVSIKSQGILQPLLVRPIPGGRYEIIAGERRWRGAQLAGLAKVPVVVRQIPDQTAMAVGLIENIQREDLNAIEQAHGYQRLLEEFGLTHQEISEVVGCARATVTNILRMLTLPAAVQKMLEAEQLDMGHARALLGLPIAKQTAAAQLVAQRQWSVRQTEALVKQLNRGESSDHADEKKPQVNTDLVRLAEDLGLRLGAKVDIRHSSKKGKLVIHYHSLDELDGILARIQ